MSGDVDPREVLRRALVEIRALKQRLAAACEPVAVTGIGCRFAGGIDGPDAFWNLLREGRDAIRQRPPGRWPGGDRAPSLGGFLDDVEGFDASFFDIAPREAAAMDPQHRLLLEVTWEALEHAAIDPGRLARSKTGVFVGVATHDFARRVPAAARDRYFGIGTSPAVASGRIAYLLDLRGPSLTIDTACSSSLVAVHYAVRALRDRTCDTALAGGVSLMLGPELGESFADAGMLAADGRCRSFDAAADGYGRGEGCGVVVLRRLSDALAAGERVLAVIRGTAVNQDGRSAGLTAPNGPAQVALIAAALDDAELTAGDIDFAEAHGTGTRLGDPIEWHALSQAFAGRDRPLWLGSVKTHLGHTEAAAGVAGLIKMVLALQHGSVPPGLHFTRRNPAISPGTTPIEVATRPVTGVRRAGVASFGFSGTNAYAVLEAAPERAPPAAAGEGVLLLSARSPAALRELAARAAANAGVRDDFLAACHTAAVGRARWPWWIAVRSAADLATAVPSNDPPPVLQPTRGPLVTLPTYPFQRARYPLPVPAANERMLLPGDALLAGTDGMAHLGVLLTLLQPAFGGPVRLRDVAFPQPLLLATARIVRARHAADGLTLESRATDGVSLASRDGDGWTQHVLAIPDLPALPGEAADIPPPAAPDLMAAAKPARTLYERIESLGFRFAPQVRCLSRIAVCGDTALGWLVPHASAHGAIEAAAQLIYALLADGAAPVVLGGAARLDWRPGGTPARAWLRRDGALAAFGMDDDQGQPLLRVEGARFVPLADQAAPWTRLVRWRPAPLPPAAPRAEAAVIWRAPDWQGSGSRGSGADALSACAGLLGALPPEGQAGLLIATHGAQATGREAAPVAVDQAAVWGLAQAILAERPALGCRLIDLDPDAPAEAQRDILAAEALARDEPAVAWRGGTRYARRLEPARPGPALTAGVSSGSGPVALTATIPAAGVLVWDQGERFPPPPGQVRIEVVAAGLTFRDRLLFAGLAPPGSALGADCAGIVRAIGEGVTGLAPGERVIALAPRAIADAVVVRAEMVAPSPCCDLVAAATMPVPYLTALAGLGDLGPSDRVLVHQAGSATGLAALAVARRAGARIVATAARHRHAWFGPDDADVLLDSRAPETWGDALDGLTVAFGAFDADLLGRLHPARVVNLDKRAGRHFDLDRVDGPALTRLMRTLGDWPPLPRHVVRREELTEALGTAAAPVGRAVILMREPPPATIEAGATYLITGAAGALGGLLARWLAGQGARVVLVDRQPVAASPPHRAVVADAGDEAAMAALFALLAGDASPLRGVFHCAGLTDDDTLAALTPGRIGRVLAAKQDGALVLDRLTRRQCVGARRLDHFVLFASLAGLLPSARQGAYAAANAVLDQIAHARHQRGWPALSLDWGPWMAGIGRAMGARAAETWRHFGVTPLLPAAALRALPALLATPQAQCVVADIDWHRHAAASGRDEPSAASPPGGRDAMSAGAPAGAMPATVASLQQILAPLLGVRDPATLDPDAPLMSFGFDSLTAVEFARALSRGFGRPVAPDFAYSHPTLARAAAALARRPGAGAPSRVVLLTPHWENWPAPRAAAGGWTILGDDALAEGLRAAVRPDRGNLVAVAPAADARHPRGWRERLFPALLARLRNLAGVPARVVLVMAGNLPQAAACEGFATAIAAEQPAWSVRSVRLDPGLSDPLAAVLRELAADDSAVRVRLTPAGRETLRLVGAPAPRGPWRADPEGTYLVTGGTGGVGALVARRLVDRGARCLVLASRRPILPPALAGSPARVILDAADLTDPDAVAALLDAARHAGPPLRGVFHAAGVTADGQADRADWDHLGRAFPAKADAAALLDRLTRTDALSEFVLFSSTTAWFGLPGTSGYAAANGFLDGLAATRRAGGLPGLSIAWCAWQGVGMAADAALWDGGRVPSLPPALALDALDAALMTDAACVVVTDAAWQQDAVGRRMAESA